MTIYLCGPMSGLDDFNRPAFRKAALELIARGHAVVNPADFPEGKTWTEYIAMGLRAVDAADAIYLLPEWAESFGARIERLAALKLGRTIYEGRMP